jgi:hypothetical protein
MQLGHNQCGDLVKYRPEGSDDTASSSFEKNCLQTENVVAW